MRKAILLFSIAIITFTASAQTYFEFADSAEKYIKAKDWSKAEAFIKDALKKDPTNNNNSLLLSNLGTIQRYQGKYDDAIKNYSIALFMTPNAVTILRNRALLYMQVDSLNAAYEDFAKIIKLDDSDLTSRYYHGMIALQNKDMDKSKSDFDYILRLSPNSESGNSGLALWNKVNGHYAQAIQLYSLLIKAKTQQTRVYLSGRAECYLRLKQLNNAEDDIKAALSLDSTDSYVYYLKAQLAKARFDNEEMKRDMELAEKYGFDKKEIEKLLK